MIDAEETLALISALEEGTPRSRLEQLLQGPTLSRMFPVVGAPVDQGLECLAAVGHKESQGALDDRGRMIVDYFEELVKLRRQFEALLSELRADESGLKGTAFEKTRELLPASTALGDVRLVFLPNGFDFKTDQETVYMDPLASLMYGLEGIRDSLSHEFHHIARYRITGENPTHMRPEVVHPPHDLREVFREWATWLELEGVADCVSNATDHEIAPLHAGIEARRRQMSEYEHLLAAALSHFRDPPGLDEPGVGDGESLRKDLSRLAHPVGFKIAERILRSLGRQVLVECVGNPGVFLRRYDEVAEPRGQVPFGPSLLGWAFG